MADERKPPATRQSTRKKSPGNVGSNDDSASSAKAAEEKASTQASAAQAKVSEEPVAQENVSAPGPADLGWRPPATKRQNGAPEIDWSRTYHVNTVEAFVNGLFGLYSGVFESFLDDAGKDADLGETVLYQVKDPAHLRFEIKKIGPNEFEVRGAHFATPDGVNICVGLDPLQVAQAQQGASPMYYYNPFTTTSTPTTTTGTPTTTTGTPTTTTGTPTTSTWGTPTTTTGTPTTTTGTPTTSTWGTPTTTTGTPTTTTGTPTTTTGTPTTSTWGTPTTTTGTPTTTTGTPTTTTGTPTTSTWGTPTTTTGTPTTTTGTPTTTTGTPTTTTGTPTTTTSTSRPGFEEFLQSGGREVINLAKELRAQAKYGLEEDKFTDMRERLNRLAGLLETYRL